MAHRGRVLATVCTASVAVFLLSGCGTQQLRHSASNGSSFTATSAVSSSATTSASSASNTGITGRIHIIAMRGPTCPVQRDGAPPCVAPYVGSLQILGSSGAVIATMTTSADGTADLSLPVGTYTVTAPPAASALPRLTQPVTVSVTARAAVTASLSFDTGIR